MIVFNIETVADPEIQQELLPGMPIRENIKPHGGIKDPSKQSDFIDGKMRELIAERDAEIAEFGLKPLTSKIICLSYKIDEGDIITIYGDNEKDIVKSFNDLFTVTDRIVGYKSKAFDLYHLAIATIRNGLDIQFNYLSRIRRYSTDLHIDLYEILTNFGQDKRGKLSDWCIRLGITPPFGKGSMVTEWHQKSDWESIKHHCSDNVRCTYELYQKVEGLI